MARLRALLVLVALLVPGAAAVSGVGAGVVAGPAAPLPVARAIHEEGPCPHEPEDCPVDPRLVGRLLNPAIGAAAMAAENATGENLTGEAVDVTARVDVTNAEIGLLGMLFGGGKIESDFAIALRLEFRAISLRRLDDALRAASGDLNASAERTLGLNGSRVVVTAEEFRLLAGGALVTAFRDAEERGAVLFVEESLPGVTVLSTRFRWANLVPAEKAREGDPLDPDDPRLDLREPPVVLEATMTLRFLDRLALSEILASYLEKKAAEGQGKDARTLLKERIQQNQTVPAFERSAFMIVGIDQLLAARVPPGWRLNLTITVPKGFTIESVTDELVLAPDKRSATYYADGSEAHLPLSTARVFTLSNRSLVTGALFVATLAVGLLLRAIVEGVGRAYRHRRELKRMLTVRVA